jgi:drug/metabolite transporter (DMT)-like permease
MSTTQSEDRSAWFLMILLSIIWGCSFILIKKTLLVFNPMQAASLRLSISAITFAPMVYIFRNEIRWNDWKKYLIVGLTGSGVPAFLFSTAQTHISSSVSGMLNSLTPIWTLMVGYWIFKTPINRHKIIGVIIGFIGALLLILLNSNQEIKADIGYSLLVLIATMCYGTSVNMVQAWFKDIRPIVISCLSFFLAGIPAWIGLLVFDVYGTASTHPEAWFSLGSVTTLSIFGTVIATILFYHLVQRTSAIFASTVTYLMPFMALILGMWDGEYIGLGHIIGMLTILVGVWLTKR